MCGLGVYISNEPKLERAFEMWQHLEKRGPDNFGSWMEDLVYMYHTRLAIVDLSKNGAQPMISDRWTLVYNGEIYNNFDLRTKLGPMHWASHSDTLTLLNCIEHKGIEWTINNIEGMFAFAAYDRFEKRLYMAVDSFGIKPLYWTKTDKFFACASSPGALTHLKDKWTLDTQALIDMLALGATKTPLFSGMNRIGGGEMVVFDIRKDTVTTTKWYTRKEHQCNENDLLEAVKHSIQITKVSDVQSFIFLSGGIDSTVVASQCQHMNAVHLQSPEEVYAKQAADKYRNTLFFVDPENYSAKECLEDYARQSGDCSMAAIVPYVVSKEVAKFGKVAISANGADELMFGYSRMDNDVSLAQFRHIFRNFPSSWDMANYKTTRELELQTYVEYDLNKTLDFASMAHSLEIRVPYLNKTVVEMALSLDRNVHVNGYGPKSILKKFLKSEGFDDNFIHRQKIGFSLHKEPHDYALMKVNGMKLLKEQFGIHPKVISRDARYYECSAAAFYCFYQVWKNKLS